MREWPITDLQKQLLEYIRQYIQKHGYAPTQMEMMRDLGYKNPQPIYQRLRALKRKGFIDWKQHKARTITIL